MRRLLHALAVAGVAITLALPHALIGQAAPTDLVAVRALYVAADYEGALRLLANADPAEDLLKTDEYRALCLLALGRTDEAARSIERIFARDPLYAVDPTSVSPRMMSLVSDVRQRLLPVLARNLYALARKNIEHREFAAAVAQLTEMMAVVEAAGPGAGLDDLRSLGGGFLDLARKELSGVTTPSSAHSPPTSVLLVSAGSSAPPERFPSTALPTEVYAEFLKLAEDQTSGARAPQLVANTANAAAPVTARPDIYTDVDRIQPPVPVQRDVPRWQPPDEPARQGTHTGLVELVIDKEGAVESVSIAKSVHAAYDAPLLEAARKWRYRPATRDGQPVRYRLVTPVVLRPPAPPTPPTP
jgi:TonB family protein